MTAEIPIACTLGAGDYRKRMKRIDTLNRKHFKRHEQDGLALRLVYRPEARAKVRELIALEQACCPFLDFKTSEGPEEITLTITAPERARDAAEALFAYFVAGVKAADQACGCC